MTIGNARRMGAALKWACLVAATLALAATTASALLGETKAMAHSRDSADRLEIYYRSPVLVRSGERVRIPVDAFCATAEGTPCPVRVSLSTPMAEGSTARAAGRPGLRFDLSLPATRALRAAGSSAGASIPFRISARDESGRAVSLPSGNPRRYLRVYVTARMPVVHIPGIPFGHVRRGRLALYMPWGSGPRAAGLAPGNEAPTLGPPSFDVDARGRIYVLDALHHRVAVFSRDRLVRRIHIETSDSADLAVAADGTTYVAFRRPGSDTITAVALGRRGTVVAARNLGTGILDQLRASAGVAYAHLLPLDAWVSASPGRVRSLTTGRPVGSGRTILSSVVGTAARLGTVGHGGVANPVEVRSSQQIGSIGLAEPYGRHGYLAVVHTWRQRPRPADQFEVVRLNGAHATTVFAVPHREFAEMLPDSRFRLGADGNLYAMQTSPDGLRIVRYEIGGER